MDESNNFKLKFKIFISKRSITDTFEQSKTNNYPQAFNNNNLEWLPILKHRYLGSTETPQIFLSFDQTPLNTGVRTLEIKFHPSTYNRSEVIKRSTNKY